MKKSMSQLAAALQKAQAKHLAAVQVEFERLAAKQVEYAAKARESAVKFAAFKAVIEADMKKLADEQTTKPAARKTAEQSNPYRIAK